MNIQDLLEKRKEIYNKVLMFIDNDDENDDEPIYNDLINFLESFQITENISEIRDFLVLMQHIDGYHRINQYFKIERILRFFFESIKKNFTCTEIFTIFRKNRRILQFLIKNEILLIDDSIIQHIYEYNPKKQYLYFASELKKVMTADINKLIDEDLSSQGENAFHNYEQNRQIGENDSYICKLIREDSCVEFIQYINQSNLNLSIQIKESIFETNIYLIENKPTLIEYAAYFGSIQIFQYLLLNNAEITKSLMYYAIHGRNPEIIHLIEELHVVPEYNYKNCYEEAIKCHHNEIAAYFENFIDLRQQSIKSFYFKYWNYSFFPNNLNDIYSISYLCEYGHSTLVNFILQTTDLDINTKVLHTDDIFHLFI